MGVGKVVPDKLHIRPFSVPDLDFYDSPQPVVELDASEANWLEKPI